MKKETNSMIIEFIGAPGSGKSTVIKKLAHQMKEDSFFDRYEVLTSHELGLIDHKKSRRNPLKAILVFIKIVDAFVLFSVLHIIKLKYPLNEKKRLLMYFLNIVKRYKSSNRNRSSREMIILFDEGLFHALCAINYKLKNDKKRNYFVETYYRRVMANKRLNLDIYSFIFVESSVNLSYNRINLRQQGWPKSWTHLENQTKLLNLNLFRSRVEELQQFLELKEELVLTIKNDTENDSHLDDHLSKIKEYVLKQKVS